MTDTASDPLAVLARLLTAPAAHAASSPAGALLVAVAALLTRADAAAALRLPVVDDRDVRVVIQRGHVVELGGLPVERLLRLTGARPVEIGAVDHCAAAELQAVLADGAAGAVFVERPEAAGAGLIGPSAFVWACRQAAVPCLVVAAGTPLPALDAGADLALVDLAATYGGNELGLVVGRADLIAACALQQLGLGRLFRPDAAAMAAAVAAVRATAADPAAGLAQADL